MKIRINEMSILCLKDLFNLFVSCMDYLQTDLYYYKGQVFSFKQIIVDY